MSKNAAQQHKKSVKKFPFEKVQVKMYSVNNPLKMVNRRRRQKEKKVRSHQYISLHQLHIYKATKYSHVNYFVT